MGTASDALDPHVQFEEGAFGKALTSEQKKAYLDAKYGGPKASSLDLIEDVAMLEFGGPAEKQAETARPSVTVAAPPSSTAPLPRQSSNAGMQADKGERISIPAPIFQGFMPNCS